jgi:hypothetical protein
MKGGGGPSGYVEGLNDARTPHGKKRVLARRGWAGEKSDFFSILLENPRQLSPWAQLPSSGGASSPSPAGWSKFLIAVFSHCRKEQRNRGGTTEEAQMNLDHPVLKVNT